MFKFDRLKLAKLKTYIDTKHGMGLLVLISCETKALEDEVAEWIFEECSQDIQIVSRDN